MSVIAASDINEFGDGSIDVDGDINIDGRLGENTSGNGIFIRNIKDFTMKTDHLLVSNPMSNELKFFISSPDNLFKSINSSGIVTTYQPLNTKGDILTHDGNTQIRLPVSLNDGFVLSADSSQPSGLKWVEQTGVVSNPFFNDEIIVYVKNLANRVEIADVLQGAYFNAVYNKIDKGPSANFFMAKSNPNINIGIVSRLNNVTGNDNITALISRWNRNEEPEIFKNTNVYNGNYSNKFYSKRTPDFTINLNGSSWNDLYNTTTGNYIISINNQHTGPVAMFFVSKNEATNNGASIVRIISSPGTSNTNLSLRWLANSSLQIRKNKSFDDGEYLITNLLSNTTDFTSNISGTNQRSFIGYSKFQRYSGAISVSSTLPGGPSAIFTLSKNFKNKLGNISRIVSSPGVGSNETLDLYWDVNTNIQISKNGNNYNGDYIIKVLV